MSDKKVRISLLVTLLLLAACSAALITLVYMRYAAPEAVCTKRACLEAAAMLVQNMDLSVDPCEDFFKVRRK